MSVQTYYDLRGQWLMEKGETQFGALSLPLVFREPHEQIEVMMAQLPACSQILDLCCGTGVHSMAPALTGHHVTAVDFSEKSVEAAKWLATSLNVQERCEFRAMDALAFLRENPNRFDMIHISGSLYYFNLDEILPLIQGSLKVGGLFVSIGTSGASPVGRLNRALKQMFTKYRDEATMNRLFKVPQLQSMKSQFSQSQLSYFCFLVLFCKVLPSALGIRKTVYKILKPVDAFLLNKMGLGFLGFKYLFWGYKK